MLSTKDFIQMSLEANLFWGRIMKEHMIFIEAALPIKNSNYILEADNIKKSYEELLMETIMVSNGAISQGAIDSKELVTAFTLEAETTTENLTGVCINKEISSLELNLTSRPDFNYTPSLERHIFELNNRYINITVEVINFMEKLLSQLLDCTLFAFMYPNMLDHLIEEAKFYLKSLIDLQERIKLKEDILRTEVFWNHIMEDHSTFIRGMLDPSEKELIKRAHSFAELFEKLLEKTKKAEKENICKITRENLEAAKELKDFKTASTEGILGCNIKSIISPLLADHVLREANRYIRILKEYIKKC
ncbi:MAG: DUF2935 domain-containing protein [Tissierellia bacterium]|nr:DUF2935 domain-containing protein [Tissierellia bacterium]